jgi:hypothetical protein
MNAREMLQEALRLLGADGLCNPDAECGCDIDDLAPCEACNLTECRAAKKMKSEPDSHEMDVYGLEYYQVME